jgi:RHS repeat-associated protein
VGSNSTFYGRDNTGTLISVRDANATSYPLYDGQGSISALTNSSGTITYTYTYDPYGRQTHATGTNAQPFGYNAGYTTGGLVHYGARLYDPAIGRWTQQDPLNQAADLSNGNRYVYVGDDPLNASDPSGQSIITDAGATVLGSASVVGGVLLAGSRRRGSTGT